MKDRTIHAAILIAALVLMTSLTVAAAPSRSATGEMLAGLPLRFEENLGQTDPQVRFLARARDYRVFLTERGAVFDTPHAGGAAPLRVEFAGAKKDVRVEGGRTLPGRAHYLIGNDPGGYIHNVVAHEEVVYRGLYPGIAAVFKGNAGRVQFDFIVEPGNDPGVIALDLGGASSVTPLDDGSLSIATAAGEIRLHAPLLYQERGERRTPVEGRFVVDAPAEGSDNPRLRFEVGRYDRERTLVIDPVVSFSSYLGGSDHGDEIWDITVDADGDIYLTGFTQSIDFPTANAMDVTLDSNVDGFVTKMSADGSMLLWSTYFGGDRDDNRNASAIAVDAAEDVYLAGETSGGTFPTTVGSFESVPQGLSDCYVTKLRSDGTAILYSTILGGPTHDRCRDIAVDATGSAYVVGEANSSTFPTTPGVYQETMVTPTDAFLAKVNHPGSNLVFSTFLGGSGSDVAYGVALVAEEAIVVGETGSSTDFPIHAAFQGTFGGGVRDAFVTRFTGDGTGVIYSTFAGGSVTDRALDVDVDDNENVHVAGYTTSSDFPTTTGAFQETLGGGGQDGFVLGVQITGGQIYGTYLGGSSSDKCTAIAVGPNGWPRVTGQTFSSDFPVEQPTQGSKAGTLRPDAFVTTLKPDGSALGFSTYLGGDDTENTRDDAGIVIGPHGGIIVAGQTVSQNFPTTAGSYQDSDPDGTTGGTSDGFIVKFHECVITDLTFDTTKTDFQWLATGLDQCAAVFDVVRGLLFDLRSGGDFSGALCLEDDDTDTMATDASDPPIDDGYWYLARADGTTWNSGGGGQVGNRDSALTACP